MSVVLENRYELLDILGRGGMAEVYRARDTRLGRDVAIKLLNATCSRDPGLLERFRLESRALARLSDPRIVTLLDAGETDDGRLYLVMEQLRGETLHQRLDRLRAHGERMPWDRIAEIVRQVCAGLATAHAQDIVHRDIKPSNLFLCAGDFVKILDFGVAKSIAAEGVTGGAPGVLTESGVIFGTPHYVAPEAIEPDTYGPIGPQVDVFALGVILYKAVVGVLPHEGLPRVTVYERTAFEDPARPSVRAGRPVDPRIEAIVMRAIARDPRDRFAGVHELAAAIAEVDTRSTWTVPAGYLASSERPAQRDAPGESRGRGRGQGAVVASPPGPLGSAARVGSSAAAGSQEPAALVGLAGVSRGASAVVAGAPESGAWAQQTGVSRGAGVQLAGGSRGASVVVAGPQERGAAVHLAEDVGTDGIPPEFGGSTVGGGTEAVGAVEQGFSRRGAAAWRGPVASAPGSEVSLAPPDARPAWPRRAATRVSRPELSGGRLSAGAEAALPDDRAGDPETVPRSLGGEGEVDRSSISAAEEAGNPSTGHVVPLEGELHTAPQPRDESSWRFNVGMTLLAVIFVAVIAFALWSMPEISDLTERRLPPRELVAPGTAAIDAPTEPVVNRPVPAPTPANGPTVELAELDVSSAGAVAPESGSGPVSRDELPKPEVPHEPQTPQLKPKRVPVAPVADPAVVALRFRLKEIAVGFRQEFVACVENKIIDPVGYGMLVMLTVDPSLPHVKVKELRGSKLLRPPAVSRQCVIDGLEKQQLPGVTTRAEVRHEFAVR